MQARGNFQLVLARMEVGTSMSLYILTYGSFQKIVPLELSRYLSHSRIFYLLVGSF